jgi:hypothetical protein
MTEEEADRIIAEGCDPKDAEGMSRLNEALLVKRGVSEEQARAEMLKAVAQNFRA